MTDESWLPMIKAPRGRIRYFMPWELPDRFDRWGRVDWDELVAPRLTAVERWIKPRWSEAKVRVKNARRVLVDGETVGCDCYD